VTLKLRMSPALRDRLKEAAAATRPESSTKLGSASRVVRESLRDEFGMSSTDNGATLERLSEWRERNPDYDYFDRTPVTPRDEADVAEKFKNTAFGFLLERNRELGDELAHGTARQTVLPLYLKSKSKAALERYRTKVERYSKWLPLRQAEEHAMASVAESDVLHPPLTAKCPEASGSGLGPFGRIVLEYLLQQHPQLYLKLRLASSFDRATSRYVSHLSFYLRDREAQATEAYDLQLDRSKHLASPYREERATELALSSCRSLPKWEPPK